MLCRLGVYRLVVSHTFLYKKLDEYGKDHNGKILEKVLCEGKRLQAIEKGKVNFDDHVCNAADTGRKIVFDNFDFKQQVHSFYRLLKWQSGQSKFLLDNEGWVRTYTTPDRQYHNYCAEYKKCCVLA